MEIYEVVREVVVLMHGTRTIKVPQKQEATMSRPMVARKLSANYFSFIEP